MKKNTQKILLALYAPLGKFRNKVAVDDLKRVVPQLSDGGFRSLLHNLKKNNLVSTRKLLGQTTVSLTHQSEALLEVQFPALSNKWDDWSGNWECMVFLSSPKTDKHFRYLRKLILDHGCLTINRGVYIAPDSFSEVVINECRQSYRGSVLIFSVDTWKIAIEDDFIIDSYEMLDIAEAYSGISKDITRLTSKKNTQINAIDRSKEDISMVYDRVIENMQNDPGFITFYLPSAPKGKELLFQLNSLVFDQKPQT
jgi:DNA-binding transcriptional regulator PaaX